MGAALTHGRSRIYSTSHVYFAFRASYTWNKPDPPAQADIDAIVAYDRQAHADYYASQGRTAPPSADGSAPPGYRFKTGPRLQRMVFAPLI